MLDISVIITGHREGVIAGPTIGSALRAIDYAQDRCGLRAEIIAVLDRPDDTTRTMIASGFGSKAKIIEVDEGDPGVSRNYGVRAARGRYVSFLDADDLWSYNWLANAWSSAENRPDVVWHSECNITFGNESSVWWHVDSESDLFDVKYLEWANYWDALSFGRRDLYLEFPFRRNDLAQGFGHEDWDWNRLTFFAGLQHKPVLDTMHFKRRRARSQMSRVLQSDSLVRPLPNVRQASPGKRRVVATCVGDAFDGSSRLRDVLARDERLVIRSAGEAVLNIDTPWAEQDRAVLLFQDEPIDQGGVTDSLAAESKAIMVLRDPLDRACALLVNAAYDKGNMRGQMADETLVGLFHAIHSSAASRLDAAKTSFGDRLLVVSYDRLNDEAFETLTQIGRFIGLDDLGASRSAAKDLIDQSQPGQRLSEQQIQILAHLVRDEAEKLAAATPDIAGKWVERIREISLRLSASVPESDEEGSLQRLLRLTESLGDNCEFGFVQRQAGYEPSSLFRWSIAGVDDLIEYLSFPRELFNEHNLKLNHSALIYDAGSGFYFHSDLVLPSNDGFRLVDTKEEWTAIYRREKRKIDYLQKKFFNQLKNKPGIYLVKSNSGVSDEQASKLLAALRKYNQKHILLRIVTSDEFMFSQQGDGLYVGTIGSFAKYESANVFDYEGWIKILQNLGNRPDVMSLIAQSFSSSG